MGSGGMARSVQSVGAGSVDPPYTITMKRAATLGLRPKAKGEPAVRRYMDSAPPSGDSNAVGST